MVTYRLYLGVIYKPAEVRELEVDQPRPTSRSFLRLFIVSAGPLRLRKYTNTAFYRLNVVADVHAGLST